MDTPVTGSPRLILRAEGLAVLVGAVVAYYALDVSWWRFALLVLVPDVALAGYAMGPRVGAICYNALHTYLAPLMVAAVAWSLTMPALWPLVLIWVAHIGMDRALGLGLKFSTAFRDTHLGAVGLAARGSSTAH